jgi:REP element-mobilizing transposase RayT
VNYLEPEFPETDQEQREQSKPRTDLQLDPPAFVPKIEQENEHGISRLGETFETEVDAHQYLAEVSYSCLMIPRFDDHYLTGDIAEDLVDWVKEICISYGWRLDGIVVRPGYLQWVMTVPLTENPARVMRLIRQHTSQNIFEDFPRYKRKNMSGDFWAPGYYVAPGDQLLSLESISSFTLATRKQQGIF